jgi:stress-induced morphogen
MNQGKGPLYTSIQTKLSAALSPSRLDLIDESWQHAGHAAMKDVSQKETHFRWDPIVGLDKEFFF